jgi:hypothetical protein
MRRTGIQQEIGTAIGMIRVIVTIVLPLLLPTALYLLWVTVLRAPRDSGSATWRSLPWVWLAGAGALLLAVVLIFITVGFGTSQQGVYIAPRYVGGRIVPGHIETQAPR